MKHDNGGERDDSGAESEAESDDHVTREPEADDVIIRGGAESPPLPRDNDSDLGSTVSNPLEDSEYVYRCKARHITQPRRPQHIMVAQIVECITQ